MFNFIKKLFKSKKHKAGHFTKKRVKNNRTEIYSTQYDTWYLYSDIIDEVYFDSHYMYDKGLWLNDMEGDIDHRVNETVNTGESISLNNHKHIGSDPFENYFREDTPSISETSTTTATETYTSSYTPSSSWSDTGSASYSGSSGSSSSAWSDSSSSSSSSSSDGGF